MKPVLLCDLDGVLVDSTRAIARVYRAWARRHGLNEERVVATAQGRPSREVVRICAPALDRAVQQDTIDAAHIADQDGVVAIAGAAELLTQTPPQRIAVVTSCSTPLAVARLAAAGLAPPRVCITEEQLTRGKPDPEGYLRAASALGVVDPTRCVVLEDAPAGVAAGLAAGMHVIGVLTSHASADLVGAHAFVTDLRDVATVAARLVGRGPLSSRAVGKTNDPIRTLLSGISPALFLGNPAGTVAIMQDKVVEAGGDPDEVLAWVREHGGYPDKTFGVRARQGFDMRPKAPSKHYYVVPEDVLK
jgi:sugar-phosphatase